MRERSSWARSMKVLLGQELRRSNYHQSSPTHVSRKLYTLCSFQESGKKTERNSFSMFPQNLNQRKGQGSFKALDEKIKERQAREKGICPVREELYSQCFDDIIRQVTIECPERGLLLLRVRDEIKMTIALYQTLYDSGILFGIRKKLQAESGKEELKKRLEELDKKKIELANKKIQLDNKLKAFEKQIQERNQIETAKREHESAFLRQQNESLDKFLKSIDNSTK